MKNVLDQLKQIATHFGISIQSADTPDEFVLIDTDGVTLGNGDDDWTLLDIYKFLGELCQHPEGASCVVL